LSGCGEPELPSFSQWGQQWTPRILQFGVLTPGEPELPSVVPKGATMDTTGSATMGRCTPESLSLNPDGLPLVPQRPEGRPFRPWGVEGLIIWMEIGRKVIWCHFSFHKCGQISIATTCMLFGQRVSKFLAIRFSRTHRCASRRIGVRVF